MQTDHRTILSLVALGRITPAEAERLLIAWNEGREWAWIFIACIAAALLAQLNPQQGLSALLRIAHALLPGGRSIMPLR
ncbi:MAG TPA: hypothetical protein VN776_14410 [Terracidiphilus sp.]|nr:hypothetical protein [Terracidiphilus sp.]